jgi:hypothetical protein
MKRPDAPVAIPAPTAKDKRFQVGDKFTVYEAALVYVGRHPYPHFFGLKGGRNSKREHMLTYLNLKRPWAQLARDIFYELGARIRRGEIKPIRSAHDASGIDLFRTVIRRANVLELAAERGEQPKYLKRWLRHATRKTPTPEAAITRTPPGPKPGTVRRYDASDSKLLPELERLMDDGLSRTAATLMLAEAGKIAGPSTTASKAKRLARLHKLHQSKSGEIGN